MDYIKTKTIMTKSKHGESWFGEDYHMNLYKGCNFGCIYCDCRSECYHIDNFYEVRAKENEIEILDRELSTKGLKGVVGIGSISDTYNGEEKYYKLTRQALLLIQKYQFGVSINTKSDLILRDIPILQQIASINNVIVEVSISTTDDDLALQLEPGAPTSTKRFEVIQKLSEAGIFTGVILNPVLPFLTDSEENIREIVQKAYVSGAKFVISFMSMTLRDRQREYYFQALEKLYPGLTYDYKAVYGNEYNCKPIFYEDLKNIFENECEKYGLLYKMEDIIRAYKVKAVNPSIEQISLF